MKKLLSIFLVLIMCTGWLVSCDNEDATSSSESQSESSHIQSEHSSEISHANTEETVYYNEIENFTLKENAPNSGLYDSYDKLLEVLEVSSGDFDEKVFDENYILMINKLICSPYEQLGFSNIRCYNEISTLGEKTSNSYSCIMIDFQQQVIEGMDYPAVETYKSCLLIIPKECVQKSFIGENNVIVCSVYKSIGDK